MRSFLPADCLPQRLAIVQIVRNDRAMPFRCLHRFHGDQGRGFRESTKNAASVEPSCSQGSEDIVPIKITGLHLRDRGISAIGTSDSRTYPESAFREVQPIASLSPDSIVFNPFHQ